MKTMIIIVKSAKMRVKIGALNRRY